MHWFLFGTADAFLPLDDDLVAWYQNHDDEYLRVEGRIVQFRVVVVQELYQQLNHPSWAGLKKTASTARILADTTSQDLFSHIVLSRKVLRI